MSSCNSQQVMLGTNPKSRFNPTVVNKLAVREQLGLIFIPQRTCCPNKNGQHVPSGQSDSFQTSVIDSKPVSLPLFWTNCIPRQSYMSKFGHVHIKISHPKPLNWGFLNCNSKRTFRIAPTDGCCSNKQPSVKAAYLTWFAFTLHCLLHADAFYTACFVACV